MDKPSHRISHLCGSFTFPRSLFFFFCPLCKESSGLSKTVSTKVSGASDTVWHGYEVFNDNDRVLFWNILELKSDLCVQETFWVRVEVEVMTLTLRDPWSLSSSESSNLDLFSPAPSNCCSAFWVMGGCNVGASVVYSFTHQETQYEMSCVNKHELRI